MDKVRIGVVGCGNISNQYFNHAKLYDFIEMAAVADLNNDVAKAKAAEHGITRVLSVDELMRDANIDIVLNLTIPVAHAEIALQAIENGKHTYSEKPFGLSLEEGKKILAAAEKKGVRTGCAPDTFFGAGHQTARKLLDDGVIGKPLVATAYMLGRGHESWHPNPEFYYKPGGGPMLDMGPYYLTALQNMLGKIKSVTGAAGIMINPRTITHKNKEGGPGPKHGQKITVETPDHVTGTLNFANGVIGTIITSFAMAHAPYDGGHPITIFGTEGTMQVPDPNGFDGSVKVRKLGDAEYVEVPLTHQKGFGRMAGVADMAKGIRANRPHRASGALAFQTLQAMLGFLESARTGKAVELIGELERPAALPTELVPGKMD